jgi:hypothetical protein
MSTLSCKHTETGSDCTNQQLHVVVRRGGNYTIATGILSTEIGIATEP